MPDREDWSTATFEGSRRARDEAFRRLTFREKVEAIEEMNRVAEVLSGRRYDAAQGNPSDGSARADPVLPPPPGPRPGM